MSDINSENSSKLREIIDIGDFNKRIVGTYNHGNAEKDLPADLGVARSIIPAATATLRDFSYIAPDIPLFKPENCVACMDCVTECPDTAILGKVISKSEFQKELSKITNPAEKEQYQKKFTETTKFTATYEKKGEEGGLFGIFVDPTKCKGCAECVEVCGNHQALEMVKKTSENLPRYKNEFEFFNRLPETPKKYINEKLLSDMMLAGRSLLYVGGAGSCMGCGEGTVIRMMLAATGFVYGPENVGLVASTGCNTVYTSTYPYNPYRIPWTNSLFENGPADAMGVRAKWDQMGWKDKKIWLIGGDGAMLDIGFQSLSRLFMSGMNVKVLILDTQVYSNTGGQASTSSFMGQEAKMSAHGTAVQGKSERRKEMGQIAMMHPDVFVANTTAAHTNHFYRAVMAANEYNGPAVITAYTTCQPEHGVADHLAGHQAKLACDSRAFPIFIYDPRKGKKISERLSLAGNPAINADWYVDPKTGQPFTFVDWARTEGRFQKQFDKDGKPSEVLLKAQQDRLDNWHLLQELAGII